MLFNSSPVYAPGEPHGTPGTSGYQNVSVLGHYDLKQLAAPNVLVGLAGIAVIAYLLHRRARRR